MKKMITILGPTASGKTPVAAHLAAKIGGEIISADSRQVYRRMDIGTGKDLADYTLNINHETLNIPYHLIDICEPGTKYGLCVIATDNVGWNEPKDIKAEKEVTTSGTGINGILVDDPASSDFIDMQGRRLKDPKASGVYIQNKKKVFIKKLIQDDLK